MLNDISYEEYLIKYNKFPKTKYLLLTNNTASYSFVTTSKSEEEAIIELKKIAGSRKYMNDMYYKIYSERDGEKKLLAKGKV
jgi:hypothetical protein